MLSKELTRMHQELVHRNYASQLVKHFSKIINDVENFKTKAREVQNKLSSTPKLQTKKQKGGFLNAVKEKVFSMLDKNTEEARDERLQLIEELLDHIKTILEQDKKWLQEDLRILENLTNKLSLLIEKAEQTIAALQANYEVEQNPTRKALISKRISNLQSQVAQLKVYQSQYNILQSNALMLLEHLENDTSLTITSLHASLVAGTMAEAQRAILDTLEDLRALNEEVLTQTAEYIKDLTDATAEFLEKPLVEPETLRAAQDTISSALNRLTETLDSLEDKAMDSLNQTRQIEVELNSLIEKSKIMLEDIKNATA